MMLENVVESQVLKILSLQEELEKVKDEVSTSLCEQCEWLEKSERDSLKHLIMKKIVNQLLQSVIIVHMRVMMNVN